MQVKYIEHIKFLLVFFLRERSISQLVKHRPVLSLLLTDLTENSAATSRCTSVLPAGLTLLRFTLRGFTVPSQRPCHEPSFTLVAKRPKNAHKSCYKNCPLKIPHTYNLFNGSNPVGLVNTFQTQSTCWYSSVINNLYDISILSKHIPFGAWTAL